MYTAQGFTAALKAMFPTDIADLINDKINKGQNFKEDHLIHGGSLKKLVTAKQLEIVGTNARNGKLYKVVKAR